MNKGEPAVTDIYKYVVSGRYFWVILTVVAWFGLLNAHFNSYPLLILPSALLLLLVPLFWIKKNINLKMEDDRLVISQCYSLFGFRFALRSNSCEIESFKIVRESLLFGRLRIIYIANMSGITIVKFLGLRKYHYDKLDDFFS